MASASGKGAAPPAVAVIGGGIAGIQASLDLADMGVKVYLIEKKPSVGGVMAQLDKTFPTNDCAVWILSPKLGDVGRHPNVEILAYSEVTGAKKKKDGFEVSVLKKARYVDATKCTACGACVEKCPTKVPNDFDMGLGKRKAIYMYFAQGIPAVMTIDADKCIYHKRIRAGKKPACQNCQKVCEADAVDFEQKDEEVIINVGAVIVATGLELVGMEGLGQYGHGRFKNVVNALEYERLMSAAGPTMGHLKRPSDGELPKNVAFLQCVGSRDLHHNRYCSSVCCMHSIKEAILTRDHYPETQVAIFYMDLRAVGKWFHKYRVRGEQQYDIRYVKGRVSHIEEDTEQNLVVHYEEVTSDKIASEKFDMVVLATGLRPGKGAAEMAKIFGFELDEYGFVKTDPLEPLDTTVDGIYVAGYAQSPKDIPETVAQTSGAAQRAAEKVLGAVAAK